MVFETKSKDSAPLIEIVEEPETRTQLRPRKPRVMRIRNYAEDTSAIDLSTRNTGIVVYVRPFADGEKLKELLKEGNDKKTYLFRGITPPHLRHLVCNATIKIGREPFTEIEKDVFQFTYRRSQKRRVYESIESLHRTYGN